LLVLFVFVGGWELIVWALDIPSIIVPLPHQIIVALWQDLMTRSFYYHFGVTAYEIIAGFLIGAGIGLVLGILIGQWTLVEKVIYPYVVAFQTVPKVAIAPMLVIWFGYGIASKIVITTLIAFFPVVVNCIAGMGAASADEIDMLRSFTASRWQIFRMIKAQSALPYIFAGFDISIVLAVIGAIVGEFVGAQAGLGYLLLQRNFSMDTAGSFAIFIVLSAMGMVLHKMMNVLRKRVVFWVDDNVERSMEVS
jgi:NitT/TauT family transport system permease protein